VAIVAVFKKGNSASVSNYRPISILKNFSKLFELIVQDHISHHFKFKLDACQHGFTKSKSTITNLVTYFEFITPLVTSQGQADDIYFDLSSAFHLVQKLSAFGVSDGYVNWFCSYLTNRKSQVRVSKTLSWPFVMPSGVPQGSVLGPLLFNIFINDLCNAINHSRYLLLADDIKIFRAIRSPYDCSLLQSDIDSVQSLVHC
jgi:hypothetical protein